LKINLFAKNELFYQTTLEANKTKVTKNTLGNIFLLMAAFRILLLCLPENFLFPFYLTLPLVFTPRHQTFFRLVHWASFKINLVFLSISQKEKKTMKQWKINFQKFH